MKTCVAEDSSGGILFFFVVVGRGKIGLTCRKWDFNVLRKSEGSGREVVEDGVKYSPGKQRVVP